MEDLFLNKSIWGVNLKVENINTVGSIYVCRNNETPSHMSYLYCVRFCAYFGNDIKSFLVYFTAKKFRKHSFKSQIIVKEVIQIIFSPEHGINISEINSNDNIRELFKEYANIILKKE